jgi:hypothetical protein
VETRSSVTRGSLWVERRSPVSEPVFALGIDPIGVKPSAPVVERPVGFSLTSSGVIYQLRHFAATDQRLVWASVQTCSPLNDGPATCLTLCARMST